MPYHFVSPHSTPGMSSRVIMPGSSVSQRNAKFESRKIADRTFPLNSRSARRNSDISDQSLHFRSTAREQPARIGSHALAGGESFTPTAEASLSNPPVATDRDRYIGQTPRFSAPGVRRITQHSSPPVTVGRDRRAIGTGSKRGRGGPELRGTAGR
jgi:hypothetical protein